MNEIEKHIKVLKGLIENSYEYYFDAEYLSRHTDAGGVPCGLEFIGRSRISHFVISVLELAKVVVYSDNHHFNIFRLFSLIDSHNNSKSKKEKIDFNTEKYRNELKVNQKNTIKNIRKLRDKAFAHTDKVVLDPNYTFSLTFSEIKEILDCLVKVINELIESFSLGEKLEISNNKGAESAYNTIKKHS